MKIDGIAASQAIDTSAERINIANIDISTLQAGQGLFNWEHRDPKRNENSTPLDFLGAITFARKIFSADDCQDDRQKFYWNQIQLPFVYIRGELYDEEGHEAAKAIAAIIRFYQRRNLPIVARFSIDGFTVDRKENELTYCIARDVAITMKPANHSCVSGVLEDNWQAKVEEPFNKLARSEEGLTRFNGTEFRMMPFEDEVAPPASSWDLLRSETQALVALTKAMEIGSMDVAPSSLTGAAALGVEEVQHKRNKHRLRAAMRDWGHREPLIDHLKKTLPDVSGEMLEKFVKILDEQTLAKAQQLYGKLDKALLKGPALDEAIAKLPKFTVNPDSSSLDVGPLAGGKTKNLKAPQLDATANLKGPAAAPADPDKTGVIAPKPAKEQKQPVSREERAKQIQSINADAARTNPEAAKLQAMPATPPVIPHVPGQRVGIPPNEARRRDMAKINAEAAATNPMAAQMQAMKSEGEIEADELRKDVAKQPEAPVAPEQAAPAKVEAPLTIRGQAIAPRPDVKTPHFDEDRGMLVTPRGEFPMYIPSRDTPEHKDAFHRIMNAPKVNQFHNYAIDNWKRVHEKMKDGKLPESVIMHAVLFSQLSPNTPVPMQEMMYGHLVDHMKQTGADPRTPEFGATKQGWLDRDQPNKYPNVSPDHWDRLDSQLRSKTDSEATGRPAGSIKGFQLANDKWKNMARYHEIHNRLVNIIGQNGADARTTARQLLQEKSGGQGVPGLAPKTIRYTLGMLGGGNTMVPDTHFARYLFGLDKKHDGATIDHIKSVLWRGNSAGADTLDGIDRYYGKHHDAVHHLLEHPEHGKYFRDNPEAAIFPAFWKNWVGIVPHEKVRGMGTGGSNEFTDHKVFWDSIHPFMGKSEEPMSANMQMAMKTAQLHAKWAAQYGEVPAMMLYYAYIVPTLINGDDGSQSIPNDNANGGDPVVDTGTGQDAPMAQLPGTLAKAENVVPESPPIPADTKTYRGKTVIPGKVKYREGTGHPWQGQELSVLHSDDKHHHLYDGFGVHLASKEDEHKLYNVTRAIASAESAEKVGEHHLTLHSRSPKQRALIEGMDFGPQRERIEPEGGTTKNMYFIKNHANKPIFVKPGDRSEFNGATAETSYHNIANDFFGLGEHVPTTATFFHPDNGGLHSVQEFVKAPKEHTEADLERWHKEGVTPKVAIMDYLMGNNDRHDMNFLKERNGGLRLIDHGLAFQYDGAWAKPDYVPNNHESEHFGPDTHVWAAGLDPKKFAEQLSQNGVPDRDAAQAVERLGKLQAHIAAGKKLSYRVMVPPRIPKKAI